MLYSFDKEFLASYRVAMSSDERIRELCAIIATATGAEQDAAIAELQSCLTTILNDVDNLSVYNVITFPAAMEKRKRA